MVGTCPFEPDEQRASRMAPSLERFRLLTRLINLRIGTDEGERSLTPDELARVTDEDGRPHLGFIMHRAATHSTWSMV